MDVPQITAVIPTYRRPHLLRRAIESVLAQSYPHLLVQVLDNDSGDGTAEVVAGLARRDGRVQYHCQPRNIGAAANFQCGLDGVQTPYFSFLSDDDLLLPDFYAHALQTLERHPPAAFFCGQTLIHDPEDGSHVVSPRKGWEEGFHAAGTATARMVASMFTWTGALFRTDVGRAAGPLDEAAITDLLFMARAAARFPFAVSLRPCAIFTSWQQGAFHSMTPQQLVESFRRISDALAEMPEIPPRDAEEIRRYLRQKPHAVLGGRMKRAFLHGDWETFDHVEPILRGSRDISVGKRLRLFLGRQRSRLPRLVRAGQSFMARKQERQRRRHSGGRLLTAEDLLALHSPRPAEKRPAACQADASGEQI